LIETYTDEFNAIVTTREQRREWLGKKAALKKIGPA
jgi:hypothetical protein